MAQSGRQPPTTCRARSGRPRRTRPNAWSSGSTPQAGCSTPRSRSCRLSTRRPCRWSSMSSPRGPAPAARAASSHWPPTWRRWRPTARSALPTPSRWAGSTIGAAHPVSLGGIDESKPDDVMAKKLESFGASFIESIAAKHHRNVDWAKSAVRESASVTAEKALELGVVEIIARDMPDLLKQLDGRQAGGRRLSTAGAETAPIPMLAREKLFQMLWRPEVMFVLMLIAVYGIIGELTSPGAILPGVAGAIAFILLYMASIVPVSVAGLALVILALALFIIDVFAPTHGILTFGGVVSFFVGSLLFFDQAGPGFQLSLATIIPATLVTAAFFLFVVGAGLRAQRFPVRIGRETMIGRVIPALAGIDRDAGRVLVEGEYWSGRSETPVAEGQPVEIVGIDGLVLKVKPKR